MQPHDLCYLSADEALRLFREKKLSPVELMEAVIARADKVNGEVNATSQTFYEQAIEQARKAEVKYSAGSRTRALEGLPLAMKDEMEIKGLPATAASDMSSEPIAVKARSSSTMGWWVTGQRRSMKNGISRAASASLSRS